MTLADSEAGRVDEWLARSDGWRRVNGHLLEIDAGPGEKIRLLRSAAAAEAPVADLDVVPPTLDELYAHFLNTREKAE